MSTERIADRTLWHRTIAGTDWPVENVVYRDGPRRWRVAFGLCNGVPFKSEEFRTRREALTAAGIT
jgi:hypothetical protein